MLRLTYWSRQVQPAEGEHLAKENRAAWVETSAKDNVNVGELPLIRAVPKMLPGVN
jgi:hypothetical protein